MQVLGKFTLLSLVPMAAVLLVDRERSAAWRSPILILRIIETQLDPLLLRFLGERLQGIALERRCVHDIERIRLRIEHGKAIVMLRGYDDVFHARRFRQSYPGMRIELG